MLTGYSTLSDAALDALGEFYRDRDAREKQFEDLRSTIDHESGKSPLTMDAFAEDWNESQFWVSHGVKLYQQSDKYIQYSQETATLLANQLLANSSCSTTIAVISAPSVFVQLKNLLVGCSATHICLARPLMPNQAADQMPEEERPKIYLLEFDERFSVFPEFVHYDFHKPLKLPGGRLLIGWNLLTKSTAVAMRGTVDHIICDPPFLSKDCQTKGYIILSASI
jgi:hypothetical protein